MNRVLNVTTALGPQTLRFAALSGREEISRLFDFTVTMKSEQKDLDPEAMLGTPVTVEIELPGGAKRYLNGQCIHFSAVGKQGRYYLYEAQVKPWLWYATRRTDYRIFQQKTVPDMVKQVLAQYPFETRFVLTRSYRTWEYCVQYRESDANFVMRMLENEGIWFWFDHSSGEHALVITDDIGVCHPFPGYESVPYYGPDFTYPDKDHLDNWAAGGRVKPGKFMAHDYNFTMPRSELAVQRDTAAEHAHGSYDVFDYPGGYTNLDEGEFYARMRLEELQSAHKRGHAAGRARGMAPGRLFTLENHPVGSQNREYLIVASDYQFSDNDYESNSSSDSHVLRIKLETHPSDQPFRAERLTPKPQTMGPETAVVTGPAGQEIYTDEFGRVKVQFVWDRYGKKDENSSCWIRVSHPWAGSGFGGVHIPRIGQEVLVDHLNGDPDRPIITSRVYNAFQMPPWGLPANATQSGFLTRSSQGGGYDNANALRFEDKRGEEQLWIHAEKNQDIEVEHDETHWVGNDRSKTIDRDETTQVKRDRTETVDRHETITVHGNRSETVDGNETILIHQNRTETVDGNETLKIHRNRDETVDADETIAIHGSRRERVDGSEKITVHKSRTKTIDKNETDKIGSNWSVKVGKLKTETIGMANLENIGLARMSNIGVGYSLNVGMLMNTVVGMQQSTQVGQRKTLKVGSDYSADIGSRHELKVGGVSLQQAGEHLEIACGAAKIVLRADGGIYLSGTHIEIQGSQAINADAALVQINCGASQKAPGAPAAKGEPSGAAAGAPAEGGDASGSPLASTFVASKGGANPLDTMMQGLDGGNAFSTLGKLAELASAAGIGGKGAGVAGSLLGMAAGGGAGLGGGSMGGVDPASMPIVGINGTVNR